MANDLPPLPDVPQSWTEFLKKVREIVIIVASIIGGISAITGTVISALNNGHLTNEEKGLPAVQKDVVEIQAKQNVNSAVLQEVKKDAAETKVHAMKAANK